MPQRHSHKQYFRLAAFVLLLGPDQAFSQDQQDVNFQIWLDYDPTHPMGKWTFDLEIAPHFGLGESRWGELGVTPNWEYSAADWLDLSGGVALTYTHQTENLDTFEFNPYVEVKPYFYTKRGVRGIKLADYLRFEYRAQYTFEAKEKDNSARIRNRIQAQIPINKGSILVDRAWYAIVDVEAFYSVGDLKERFSSRLRLRAGS